MPLHAVDLAVIALYFTVIVAVGLYLGRFARSTADFFLAGQRFAWWVIAISCVATLVGSYSFVTYSDLGFDYGLSSGVNYTNDWFVLPALLFGWIPILYYGRIRSVPEYFDRRFDRRTRMLTLVVVLVFLVGYIGMNLQAIGVVARQILGVQVLPAAFVVAVLSLVYMHKGGQISVLGTDLLQGFILLFAGIAVLAAGVFHLGGWPQFWEGLEGKYQYPFPGFNSPSGYHFVGTFWGDAMVGTTAFYFINQGMVLRFLSARSVGDARKAMLVTVVLLMPLAAIAVSGGGWVGRALAGLGSPEAPESEKGIFISVARVIAMPGMFGLVTAAMLAALMSTLDTYVNAVAAVGVNDILRHTRPDRPDSYYLHWARWIAVGATLLGLALVPIFEQFKTVYEAHALFLACVNPPLVAVLLLSLFWRKMPAAAAFWGLLIGMTLTLISLPLPGLIAPFAHGVSPDKNFIYMRALFGLIATLTACLVIALILRKRDAESGSLSVETVPDLAREYKSGEPAGESSPRYGPLFLAPTPLASGGVRAPQGWIEAASASPGDVIQVSDARWWLGGLRGARLVLEGPSEGQQVEMAEESIEDGFLERRRPVHLTRVI